MTRSFKNTALKFKRIAFEEIFTMLIIAIPLGWWAYYNIGKKFEHAEKEYFRQNSRIEKQFDRFERQFDKIDKHLDDLTKDHREFHGRLASLEIHYEKNR